MARHLQFPHEPIPRKPKQMSLGDVLFRLALVAPDVYGGFELLIRRAYQREWPAEDVDPLELLEREGNTLLR